MIIFAGGRYNTGIDYESYVAYHYYISKGDIELFNNIVEPGYVLLNILIPDVRVLFFVIAFFSVVIKYLAIIYIEPRYVFFILLLYFLTDYIYYDMGIMRQGFAMGICLWSVRYVISHEFKKFICCIVIASAYHISSLLFLMLYIVNDRCFKKSVYCLIILISVTLVVFDFYIYQVVGQFPGMSDLEYISHKADLYGNWYEQVDLTQTVIKRGILGIFFLFCYDKLLLKENLLNRRDKKNVYLNGYVLSLVVIALLNSLGLNSIAGRSSASLYALYWFIYCEILKSYKKNAFIYYIMYFVFVMIAIYTFYSTLTGSINSTYADYRFFID